MTTNRFILPLLFVVAGLVGWGSMFAAHAVGEADVPGPGPAVAALFDAGAVDPVDPVVAADHAQPAAPVPAPEVKPPPDPEDSLGDFIALVRTVAKTGAPSAVVLVLFALVTIARRRVARLREGTTGIATATALAFLTVTAGSIAMGVPVGQSLGAGLVALLTGKALATPAPVAKAVR